MAGKGAWRTVHLRGAGARHDEPRSIFAPHIVDVFRRDLIGPGAAGRRSCQRAPEREPLALVSGRISRARGGSARASTAQRRERSRPPRKRWNRRRGAGCRRRRRCRDDNEEPEAPNSRRRFLPSSVGLTVLLDPDVNEIEARISWGDYRTEPPLPEAILLPEPLTRGARRGRQAQARRAATGRLGADPKGADLSSCQSAMAAAGRSSFPKAPPSSAGAGAWCSKHTPASSATRRRTARRAGPRADGFPRQSARHGPSLLCRCQLRISGAA